MWLAVGTRARSPVVRPAAACGWIVAPRERYRAWRRTPPVRSQRAACRTERDGHDATGGRACPSSKRGSARAGAVPSRQSAQRRRRRRCRAAARRQ
eukprot:2553296-Prymnesium_polylepis.1